MTRRELGQAERRGERGEEHLAGHHADQRADERRGHRGERAEQQRQQDDRDQRRRQLADGGVLLGGEVDEDAALLGLDAAPPSSAVSAASISASPSSFSMSPGSVV